MSDVANKRNAEIALPEAGEGVVVRCTIGSLQKLEAAYGEEYFTTVIKNMDRARVGTFIECVKAMVTEHKTPFPWGLPLEEIKTRIIDAMYLCIHGRTFEEQQKVEDELFQKRLQEAQNNPRLQAALSSMLSNEPDTAQG